MSPSNISNILEGEIIHLWDHHIFILRDACHRPLELFLLVSMTEEIGPHILAKGVPKRLLVRLGAIV